MKIENIHTNNLRNDAHFQLHTEFRDLVAAETAAKLKIKPQFDAYLLLYEKEDEALKKINKSTLTERIYEADMARDETFVRTLNAVIAKYAVRRHHHSSEPRLTGLRIHRKKRRQTWGTHNDTVGELCCAP